MINQENDIKELRWAKEQGIDFDCQPYKDGRRKKLYWVSLAWKVICPVCGRRISLAMKKGGKNLYYRPHTLPSKPNFINPNFVQCTVSTCEHSGKEYKDDLPLQEGEDALAGVIIRRLIIAKSTTKTLTEVVNETISWLREYKKQ